MVEDYTLDMALMAVSGGTPLTQVESSLNFLASGETLKIKFTSYSDIKLE